MMSRLLLVAVAAILLTTAAAAQEYPPGLMYSTVLNGVQLLPDDGRFRLDNIQAVFLPKPDSTTYYPYDPEGGGKLWTILSTTDGTELYRFDWYGELLKSPFWLLSSYKATDLRTGQDAGVGWVDLPDSGEFVLDFYVEGVHFYTFPFSTSTIAADDPYAGDPLHFIHGDWADWGYFYYVDANPDMSIQFKVWLNNYEHATHRDVKPRMEIRRGGTLVATGRENMTYSLQPRWVRYEMDLIFPMEGTSGGAYFKAKDLLNTDGDYTLSLYLSDELYGTWPFSVKDGQLATVGRADRGSTEPLTYIDGGRDAFWFKRQ
jgi:hypothetical protein